MKVGFIGLGIMGSRMAANLIKSGIDVTVYNRDRSKTEPLSDLGASVANDLQSCVQGCDIVITMLTTPEVVMEVAFREDGFITALSANTLWIDCSTLDPSSSQQIARMAAEQGVNFLDAPVAGTKQPAENGELVFFVGGKAAYVEKASPLLDIMGKKTIHLGDNGKGAAMKMLINLMLAQSMLAFSETVSLGKAMGLPVDKVHGVLLNTPVTAPFLQNIQQKIETKETSANFPLKWMQKDLQLAAKAAYEYEAPMPLANLTKELFAQAKIEGKGDEDFSSIYHMINDYIN
ncbi:MAG: NAD(P)-dependent oxidoreductase [Bacteroidota bacterium]